MALNRNAPGKRLFRVAVCLLLLDLLIDWHTLPSPRPTTTPADAFSAARALDELGPVLGDGSPHAVGTSAADRVRQRIVDRLTALHLNPSVREGYGCHPRSSSCGPVRNVVGRLEGSGPGKAVLLAVHYDSVPAGPGAADDGSGVAIALETARALTWGAPPKRSVIFLFDEGEEAGLLGAEAFAAYDPLMGDIGAVVNLEARGTTGASRLFETSGPGAWLIDQIAPHLPRPNTTSLYTSIYERLPNDTDLSVFKRSGVPGVNFAFIGGALRYHTPDDNLAHLDPGSLQQQGDNALASVRALATADIGAAEPGQSVFFDVAELFVVRWPQRWALPLALLALALVIGVLLFIRPRPSWTTLLVRVGAIVGVVAVTFGVTSLLLRAEKWAGALPNNWVAHPIVLLTLMWIIPIAVGVTILWVLDLFVDPPIDWLSSWLLWALLGVATTLYMPGASYIFVAPTLIAGVVGLICLAFDWWLAATLVPCFAAAVLLFPHLTGFYDALGVPVLPGYAAFIAFFLSTLMPLIVAFDRPKLRAAFPWALGSLALGLVLLAAIPAVSADMPGPLSLQLRINEAHQASWIAVTPEKELPATLARAASFAAMHPDPNEPPRGDGFIATASNLSLPGPAVQIFENITLPDGMRRVRLHVASPRHAGMIEIGHGANGRKEHGTFRVITRSGDVPYERVGWMMHAILGVPSEGLNLEIVMPPADNRLLIQDTTLGLPPEGQPLIDARPPSQAPLRRGDVTIVSRWINL